MIFSTIKRKRIAALRIAFGILTVCGISAIAGPTPQQCAQWIEFDAYVTGTYAESAELLANSAEFYWDKTGRPLSGPCYEALANAIISALFADQAAQAARGIAKDAAALATQIDQVCDAIADLQHLRARTPEEEAELKRLQLLKPELMAQMDGLQKDVNREKATALDLRYETKDYRDAAVENCN